MRQSLFLSFVTKKEELSLYKTFLERKKLLFFLSRKVDMLEKILEKVLNNKNVTTCFSLNPM